MLKKDIFDVFLYKGVKLTKQYQVSKETKGYNKRGGKQVEKKASVCGLVYGLI